MVRECRPPAREPGRSWVARRSTIATSTPASASSPANISPVGPPPAITTACSVTATRHSRSRDHLHRHAASPSITFHPTEGEVVTASISERENREIEAANASGNTPIVFIHGLWLLASSWANWADFFTQAGYAPLTPDWPGDPETVDEARANPEVLAKTTLSQIADHTTEIINGLDKKPAVTGHSTGGL